MKKKLMGQLLVFAVTAGLLTGCGASGGTSGMASADTAAAVNSTAMQEYYESYDGGIAYDTVASEETASVTSATEGAGGAQNTDSLTLLEEKLVYHCDLSIETLEYQATVNSIKGAISKYGGIIQSESENDSGTEWYYENYQKTSGTMYNYLQVRIPSKNYDSFLAELDGVGKIISKSTSVDNISQRYYDTTAQIESLQIQEKNLLKMMEQCETIEDMITVEQRLSDVQYELNNLQTSRRYMDMDVAYSYVNISISEVMEYRRDSEPVKRNTFIDRLKNTIKHTGTGFLSFLEGLLFLIISLSPYILIIAVICLVFLRKKIRYFMEKRKEKKSKTGTVQQSQDKQE